MTIGSNIKQIRKEKRLTQSDLAKKINKGLRTVQKYESDDINIPIDVLKDIAKTLDVELTDLISDDNNAIYIDFCGEPFDDTFKKLEILSTDEIFMKDILHKEKHELNFFEDCLLRIYNSQEYDIDIYTEIFKLLGSDILQKKLGYSFNELVSNEIDLIRMALNIMNSIKDDLRSISNSKETTSNIDKDESDKKQ